MRKGRAALLMLALVLALAAAPVARAGTVMQVQGKAYNVQVRSVQRVWNLTGTFSALETVRTTGRQKGVEAVIFRYDYEEEAEDATGRFTQDEKVALVCVDGFEPELSAIADPALVTVTVDGVPLATDEAADYAQDVGWHNVYSGSYGVIFPIYLEKGSRTQTHVIQVRALVEEGCELVETARLTLTLENERVYKEECTAVITGLEGAHVNAGLVGERIYLDFPGELYDLYAREAKGEPPSVKITFAGEDGQAIQGVAWALPPEGAQEGAIALEEEVRLDGSAAVYCVNRSGDGARWNEVVFVVETQEAVYRTAAYTVVERDGIELPDPRGIYFEESAVTLEVGQSLSPQVLAVATGEAVPIGGTAELTLELDAGSDRAAVEVTADGTIVGVQPGSACLTAVYATDRVVRDESGGLARVTYRSASMSVTVVPARQEDVRSVACRLLNVRSGPGTEYAVQGQLARGQEVRVLYVQDGWARLETGGCVSVRYLTH